MSILDLQFLLAPSGTAPASSRSQVSTILIIIAMIAFMVFTYRKQKKQQKAEQEARESMQIGDEIITIGGICGKIVTVKEESIVIETGADRNKIKIMRWAIQKNITAEEKMEAEREAAKTARLEAENKKKQEKEEKKSENKSK